MPPASTPTRPKGSWRRSRSNQRSRCQWSGLAGPLLGSPPAPLSPSRATADRRSGRSRMTPDQIADNLARVRSRIDAAARRAGRNPAGITLIAVSKTFDADHVRAAWEAGQRDFGENKVQEAERKIAATTGLAGARWHLIGHLQSNKARKAAAPFAIIHSVDSIELL